MKFKVGPTAGEGRRSGAASKKRGTITSNFKGKKNLMHLPEKENSIKPRGPVEPSKKEEKHIVSVRHYKGRTSSLPSL